MIPLLTGLAAVAVALALTGWIAIRIGDRILLADDTSLDELLWEIELNDHQ